MVAVVQANRGDFLWLRVLTRVQNVGVEVILPEFFSCVCAGSRAGKKDCEAKRHDLEGVGSKESQTPAEEDRVTGDASKSRKETFWRLLENMYGVTQGLGPFRSGQSTVVQMCLVDTSCTKHLACSPGLIIPRISQRLLQAW